MSASTGFCRRRTAIWASFRSHGQRLFIETRDGWQLLDVPSAFEMTPEACRWFYKHGAGLIRIESRALTDRHELGLSIEVLSGPPARCLLSNHLAINGDDGADEVSVSYAQDGQGVFVRPIPESDVGRRFPDGGFRIDPMPGTVIERLAGDEVLFLDGLSQNQPFLCLITKPATSIGLRITGCLVSADDKAGIETDQYWKGMKAGLRLRVYAPRSSPLAGGAARLREILPWFAHNALIHYLAPRGLEQYSGGGWGTRDVCQGPVETLLALGRFEPVRDLLIRVFKQQNPDGDWPQWFMFFERERNIRPGDSHGDIVFWPVLALAQYLAASEDASILDEVVPFFAERDELAERETIQTACRTGASGHPKPAHSRHPSGGLWPWRLERIAATSRPGHARKIVQRLDRDAPLPDAHHSGRRLSSFGLDRACG